MCAQSSIAKRRCEGLITFLGKETEARCDRVVNKSQNHEANTAYGYSSCAPGTPAACTFAQDMGPRLAHLCVFFSESRVAAPPPPSAAPEGEVDE